MAEKTVKRAAQTSDDKTFDVVVVGAGFAGLYALYHLRERGLSVCVCEAGSGVGGTWYWNRYPGARVDIESVEYSYSFSEELQQEWNWTERYASQPELLKYANHVADRFDLRRHIRLNTRVTSAAFSEAENIWTIQTDKGSTLRATFCVMATGFLSAPNKPAIPGLDRYSGKQFHSADWPNDGVNFSGKRVGVIGTGSSGIQMIPIIAQQAEHLYVFQRTANFSIPLRNKPMHPEFQQSVKTNYPEWRRREWEAPGGYVSVNFQMSEPQSALALDVSHEERLTDFEYRWNSGGLCFYNSFPDLYTSREANSTLADFVRGKIHERVGDPAVAEALTPKSHPILTKRLCADTGYFETFNRQNVTLVDLKKSPIEEITADGVKLQGGVEHKVDCLVFATGFDAVTGALTRMDIRGRNGLSIQSHWASGPRTYLGLMASGFPNLFIIDGPGSPGAFFHPILLSEYQVRWVGDCISYLWQNGFASIEPSPDTEDRWVGHVNEVTNQFLVSQVDSWYLGSNIPGKPRVPMMYIGGFKQYSGWCDKSAAEGYEDFCLTRTHASRTAAVS
ncbi:MAG TPA: NAD(P)/FAD-dependent oxidoreductase [Rhizomicrobium sp.]|nr:NAD(P)/FAD-dependent oxidoreductase [Rhizomicrobium sp.]